MKVIIDLTRLDGYSDPFEIPKGGQLTVFALGLEPTDSVTFFIVALSQFIPAPCVCPPFNVTLPAVIDEMPLRCCADPVTLTRDRPWVVLDAPQMIKIRAKVNATLPLTTQIVAYEPTATPYPSDFMRGCACAEA